MANVLIESTPRQCKIIEDAVQRTIEIVEPKMANETTEFIPARKPSS